MPDFSVAIIGGGASGLLAAAHLHRRDPARKIALIEQGTMHGRGLAYGTAYDCHLLNVRAERMSAFADQDDHFLNWLKQRLPNVSAQDFVPRRIYGEYLSSIFDQACAPSSAVEPINAAAVGIERNKSHDTWEIRLNNASSVSARTVILALGNLPPANPFRFHGRLPKDYWPDPWAPGAAQGIPPEAPVLIIGTGLTMLDLVLALRSEGHRGVVHALSRRGLRPHAHLTHRFITLTPPTPCLSPRRFLRWCRREVSKAAHAGDDWRCVMDALRPHTRHIWHAWTIAQRRSFLRHARPYWDVHRHRCAPEIASQIEALVRQGTLILHRGHIQTMHDGLEGIEVEWLAPRKGKEKIRVARVINCTGPASNYAKVDLPLIVQMRRSGWVKPDALHLGIETDMEGRLVGADNRIIPNLFALGPLRRPSWWESVAIPEIREQASALARSSATTP